MTRMLTGSCLMLEAVTQSASLAGATTPTLTYATMILGSASLVLAANLWGGEIFRHLIGDGGETVPPR